MWYKQKMTFSPRNSTKFARKVAVLMLLWTPKSQKFLEISRHFTVKRTHNMLYTRKPYNNLTHVEELEMETHPLSEDRSIE